MTVPFSLGRLAARIKREGIPSGRSRSCGRLARGIREAPVLEARRDPSPGQITARPAESPYNRFVRLPAGMRLHDSFEAEYPSWLEFAPQTLFPRRTQ